MAFLAQSEKEKEEQQQGGGPAPVNQESTSQGKTLSAPGAMSSSGSGNKQQGPAKGTSSGSFTNLNNYITANKGNDAKMGATVTEHVDKSAKTADQAGDTLHDEAKTAVDAGTVNLDQGQLDTFTGYTPSNAPPTATGTEVTSNTTGTATTTSTRGGATGETSTGGRGPATGTVAPQVDKDIFGTQINAQYTGPNAANDGVLSPFYTEASEAYTATQDLADLAGGGVDDRGVLLNEVYGDPKYTRGQNLLDSFILGAGEGGMAALDHIDQTYGGYGNKFTDLVGLIEGPGGMIDTGKNTTQATRDAWREAAKTEYGELSGAIETATGEAGKANTASTEAFEKIQTGLSNPKTQADTLVGLGFTPEGAAQVIAASGGDPKTLMTIVTQSGALGTGDFLTDADRARHGELGELLGLIEGNEDYVNLYDPNASITTTGNAGGDPYSVKSDMVEAANTVATKKQEYDTLSSALASGNATEEQLTAAGIDPRDYATAISWGIDPAQFLKPGAGVKAPNLAGLIGAADQPAYAFDAEGFAAAMAEEAKKRQGTFTFGQATDTKATSVETTPEEKAAMVKYEKDVATIDQQIAAQQAILADPKSNFIQKTNAKQNIEALKIKKAGLKPPTRSDGKSGPGGPKTGDFMSDTTNLLNTAFGR